MQEYELNRVLEQYELVADSTRKTRGAILCDTDMGLLLLREASVSDSRLPALLRLYTRLSDEGFTVDLPVANREGEYVSRTEEGGRYMLRRWPSGRECDIRRTAELLRASGHLAKLHLSMRGEPGEEGEPPAAHLRDEYVRHNRELNKVRRYIRGVSPKGEFEFAFLRCFDQMYRWADAALGELERSGYDALYEESVASGSMTHGEYNYHNILVSQSASRTVYATTNFDRFRQEVQAEDLYYFLRKVLEKHGWKERLGDNMLNAYSAIRPLTPAETEYLKVRLIYPEKFWKIADSYYRSNKAWISVKSIEKLGTAIRQTEEKERFLNDIFAFHL